VPHVQLASVNHTTQKETAMKNAKKSKNATLRPWLVDVVVDTLR
jgi:hypothetical protein